MCFEALRKKLYRIDFIRGRVKGRDGKLRGCLNQAGYVVSTLHLQGRRVQIKIHRLIWIAKNGIPPVGSVIDHINRKKNDNRLLNLRLVDPTGNSNNRRSYRGEKNPAAVLNKISVKKIRELYKSEPFRGTGKRRKISMRYLAKKFNVSPSLIRFIVTKKIWKN